jgi:hypothetical protein
MRSPCCLSPYTPVSVSPLIFVRRRMRSPCCLSLYPPMSVFPRQIFVRRLRRSPCSSCVRVTPLKLFLIFAFHVSLEEMKTLVFPELCL